MKLFFKITYIIAFSTASVLLFFGNSGCSSKGETEEQLANNISAVSNQNIELKTNMRKLWEDHIIWTRHVILCIVDGLPGKDQAVKRLLQNQVDIGNAIKPYYGEEAGKKLTELLFAHINIAAEVVTAAKAGNTNELGKINLKWHKNADDIATFLCKANPNWALANMKMMMKSHLEITAEEAVQRIKKDYGADVFVYDKIHNEILIMSDVIANGISIQFPGRNNTIATN